MILGEGHDLIARELKTDPTGRGYAGKPVGEQIHLLTEPVSYDPPRYTPRSVPEGKVRDLLIQAGAWAKIGRATHLAGGPEFDAATTFTHYATYSTPYLFDIDPEAKTAVETAVTAGWLSREQADAVLDLGRLETKAGRLEQLLVLGVPDGEDIDFALTLSGEPTAIHEVQTRQQQHVDKLDAARQVVREEEAKGEVDDADGA